MCRMRIWSAMDRENELTRDELQMARGVLYTSVGFRLSFTILLTRLVAFLYFFYRFYCSVQYIDNDTTHAEEAELSMTETPLNQYLPNHLQNSEGDFCNPMLPAIK